MNISTLRTALLALCLWSVAGMAWTADARLAIPGGRALVLPVPDGWRAVIEQGPVATLSITPATGNAFQILVSPLFEHNGHQASASPEALRSYVEAAAREIAPQAVETSLPTQHFGAAKVQGYYFSATDRAPKSGEFVSMTQGTMAVDGLPVSFTILSNGSAMREPALRMLLAARRQ